MPAAPRSLFPSREPVVDPRVSGDDPPNDTRPRAYSGRVSPPAPIRRDARRNHERLLGEARRLFAERGIDAPLDELAARAGVGAGTVYRHFPNRDALVRELYDAAVAELHDFAPEILRAETGWRSVELYLERLGAWLADSPYLPLVMRRVAELDPSYRPGAEFEAGINGLVARAQAEGTLRADVTAVDLSVLVDMLGSLGQYGHQYLPFWRRQLTIVLDGLRARPGTTPMPVPGQEFAAFHDMSHAKGPKPVSS
ncbi:TetR family transcriptional regulator [Agromyces badenianii]|uniref:TetR family transcriptional regulator n=1 Tax=Agromyces badenianii TaxID=2080742 RepID=A0A2S0WYQ9_9MICO|nr:TetR family transcriptional regulator [Agromyces badenianii]